MPKPKKPEVIQFHHMFYSQPDLKMPIYKREHFMLTRLDRAIRACKHKKTSKGYLMGLAALAWKYWDKAEDIENYFKERWC